jgi:hypothetical protein
MKPTDEDCNLFNHVQEVCAMKLKEAGTKKEESVSETAVSKSSKKTNMNGNAKPEISGKEFIPL